MSKETYSYGKRDLFIWQKRPIDTRVPKDCVGAKRALLYCRRALFYPIIRQRSPVLYNNGCRNLKSFSIRTQVVAIREDSAGWWARGRVSWVYLQGIVTGILQADCIPHAGRSSSVQVGQQCPPAQVSEGVHVTGSLGVRQLEPLRHVGRSSPLGLGAWGRDHRGCDAFPIEHEERCRDAEVQLRRRAVPAREARCLRTTRPLFFAGACGSEACSVSRIDGVRVDLALEALGPGLVSSS